MGRGIHTPDWTFLPSGLPNGEVTLSLDQRQFSVEPALERAGPMEEHTRFSAAFPPLGRIRVSSPYVRLPAHVLREGENEVGLC